MIALSNPTPHAHPYNTERCARGHGEGHGDGLSASRLTRADATDYRMTNRRVAGKMRLQNDGGRDLYEQETISPRSRRCSSIQSEGRTNDAEDVIVLYVRSVFRQYIIHHHRVKVNVFTAEYERRVTGRLAVSSI